MTATPKVFGESVKVKAGEVEAVLASMDDEELYGKTLVARGFGWAIEEGLLTDYKVLVLAVDEGMVSRGVQNLLSDGGTELNLDDATKIVGCYKALIKSGLKEELEGDPQPMQRALAFCKDIASSKLIRDQFSAVVGEYIASNEGLEALGEREPLACGLEHVDGTDGAKKAHPTYRLVERKSWRQCMQDIEQCALSFRRRGCASTRCHLVYASTQEPG